MELAKLFTKLLAELKVWVEIQRLEELKVFNSLRLSVVVTAEVLTDILTNVAADVTADVTTDIAAEAIANKLGYHSKGLDTN